MINSPHQAKIDSLTPPYPVKLITTILMASVGYLFVLSFLNARGLNASSGLVALVEAMIYAACLCVLVRQMSLTTVAITFLISAWIVFTWLIRQSFDVKSLRDLIIPILFLSLGRYVADVNFSDRRFKQIIGIVVAVGLFEAIFTNLYGDIFNSFSFYTKLNRINETAANASGYKGQMLALNGYRPEGIGRTLLPSLLGAHRVSSIFIEPIALGNFAIIVLAWELSKPWQYIRKAPIYILGAVLLIILSDSRFGLMMSAILILFRCLPSPILGRIAPLLPLLSLATVIGISIVAPSLDDNFLGRVSRSGLSLTSFDWKLLMGISSTLPTYWDMGFAYVLSRFGAPLSILLIFALFLIPMPNLRGVRFRALIVLYIFGNFAVSGTSVFALKTAGILWFLFGVLSTLPREGEQTIPKFNPMTYKQA